MRIIDKTSQSEQSFDSLNVGDVFRYEESYICIKIRKGYEGGFNTYNLTKNMCTNFTTDMKVKKVIAELILYDTEREG